MRTEISRRGVVAALAVGAAAHVPAIAMTAAAMPPASPAPNLLDTRATGAQPDAELLDLGRRYDVALAAEDAASEAWTAAGEAFDRARPVSPPAMRHLMLAHLEHQFPVLGETDTICDDERSDFYNEAEVDYLRATPIRTDGGRARAAEIIAEWDRHREACLALADRLGCGDVEAAYYATVDARHALGEAIVAARATTLQGLAVRHGSSPASSAAIR